MSCLPQNHLVRKGDSEPPDLKERGEAGARDVNLLASIPGGFNACHSSGTTNF